MAESPRKEIFADNTVLVLEIEGKKWKLFGSEGPDMSAATALKPGAQCVGTMATLCT